MIRGVPLFVSKHQGHFRHPYSVQPAQISNERGNHEYTQRWRFTSPSHIADINGSDWTIAGRSRHCVCCNRSKSSTTPAVTAVVTPSVPAPAANEAPDANEANDAKEAPDANEATMPTTKSMELIAKTALMQKLVSNVMVALPPIKPMVQLNKP